MNRAEVETIFEKLYAQKKVEEAKNMADFYVRGLESVSAGLGPTENRNEQELINSQRRTIVKN